MQSLTSILYLQDTNRISTTFSQLREVIKGDNRLTFFTEELDAIQEDYERMLNSFTHGVTDSYRKEIYHTVCLRLNCLIKNIILETFKLSHQLYKALSKRKAGMELSDIRTVLEGQMAEEVLIANDVSLFDEQKEKLLQEKHQKDLVAYQQIFATILVSYQWNVSIEQEMAEVMTLPTVSEVAAQLMVSAIMVACMQVYDTHKMSCLCRVYRKATKQGIKQRALVGAVLALANEDKWVASNELQFLKETFCHKDAFEELLSLQKQLLQTQETTTLARNIEQFFMSDVMQVVKKKSSLLKEKMDEATIDEIIDAELDESIKEEVGEKIEQITAQRDQGFDVNYGSFCKMKSFGFFHQIANWFLPYYIENPELIPVCATFGADAKLLKNVKVGFVLSDGDKYSLLFMLQSMVKKIPSFKKMALGLPIFEPNMTGDDSAAETPESIRRFYLQDLFRFYHLAPMRECLENPFEDNSKNDRKTYLFLLNPFFKANEFKSIRLKICRYLAKRNKLGTLENFIKDFPATSTEDYLLQALCCLKVSKDYGKVIRLLTPIVVMNPDNVAALKLLAQAYKKNGNYADALDTYMSLPTEEKHKSGILRAIIDCQIKCGKISEALQGAYELDYHDPNNIDNTELLVKGHLAKGEFDKVIDKALLLINLKEKCHLPISSEDYLCLGISYWCKGEVNRAMNTLYKCIEVCSDIKEYTSLLQPMLGLLAEHGISATDIALMNDLMDTRMQIKLNKQSKF